MNILHLYTTIRVQTICEQQEEFDVEENRRYLCEGTEITHQALVPWDRCYSYMLESDGKCQIQVIALNSTVTSLAKEYYSLAAEAFPAAMKGFGVCTGVKYQTKNEL